MSEAERLRELADILRRDYRINRSDGKKQLRNAEHLLVFGDQADRMVRLLRAPSGLDGNGEMWGAKSEVSSVEPWRARLQNAGVRKVTAEQPEFETLWERYRELCRLFKTAPSTGKTSPCDRRTFWLLPGQPV